MDAVIVQKPNSGYKDVRGIVYHFPKTYLSRMMQALDQWVVYYEELPNVKGRFYTGLATLKAIEPDNDLPDHFFAYLTDFIDFDRLVPYRENGGYEVKLVSSDGSINGGHAQSAVRLITRLELANIVESGLSTHNEWPDRFDSEELGDNQIGFGEGDQAQYDVSSFERPTIEMLTRKKWRDRKFMQNVRSAYDRTCAFTGLRLINGNGRPEVEAAHIRPVSEGGNDAVQNGIALSGTVHWMFDRGLLAMNNRYDILTSRQLNYDVSNLLVKDMKAIVPAEPWLRPHPAFMNWHRTHVFKG